MKKFLSTVFMIILASCAGEANFDYTTKTDVQIYEEGLRQLKKENNISATEAFKQVEYNHPYSPFVAKSWIMAGYAYYKEKKYIDAIEQFERLLKFQPNHPQADYSMYMIAMSYYDQISPITRDQKMTEMSLLKMQELEKKYPDSKFTNDVKPKIIIARNNLAAKEMYIASTLVEKKNIIAALNRYQTVIKKYETTLFVPEAIFRTVEIYNIMGDKDEVKNMTRLLEVNYPKTKWYKMAKEIADAI
ncbi:MAG: outer membrane protein assembly factor BamD [Alphaproteobacteria bacterium]|nr:outer membrane protein assembly factor BamD [Alphaproteobacteria bacterium]